MTLSDDSKERIEKICSAVGDDAVLRAAVIRMLARDFPKDFLAPVRIDGEVVGGAIQGRIVSDKEWQE